jgi:hypothetical protein
MRKTKFDFATIADLLKLPPEALVTEQEAAALRRLNAKTLARERGKGGGCPFVRQDKRVLYRIADIQNFLKSRTVGSTTEADRLRPPGRAA